MESVVEQRFCARSFVCFFWFYVKLCSNRFSSREIYRVVLCLSRLRNLNSEYSAFWDLRPSITTINVVIRAVVGGNLT